MNSRDEKFFDKQPLIFSMLALWCNLGVDVSSVFGVEINKLLHELGTGQTSETLLFRAIERALLTESYRFVEFLLESGANTEVQFMRLTPLLIACTNTNIELVALLLKYGANVNIEIDPIVQMFSSIYLRDNQMLDEIKQIIQMLLDSGYANSAESIICKLKKCPYSTQAIEAFVNVWQEIKPNQDFSGLKTIIADKYIYDQNNSGTIKPYPRGLFDFSITRKYRNGLFSPSSHIAAAKMITDSATSSVGRAASASDAIDRGLAAELCDTHHR